MEADDQAIQTILTGLPKDICAAVDSFETGQKIWLHVQQMMKGSDIGIQDKKTKLFKNEKDYTQLYDFLKYNQVEVNELRAERLAGTHDPLALMANSNNSYNYPVTAVHNSGVQNVGNQNRLIVVSGIANPNANQNGNGNVVAAHAEGNGIGNNENQIRCYNCRGMGHPTRNCTVRARRRDATYLRT
nr:hypothetical protein [Tanacetum cinerariifolium]